LVRDRYTLIGMLYELAVRRLTERASDEETDRQVGALPRARGNLWTPEADAVAPAS